MTILSMSELEIKNLFQTSVLHTMRKDKYGEVHTPMVLIEEILDAIPKSAYTHPEWKWLEPAAGTGHFFLLLYLRLLKGLEKAIPDVKKRKAHILENMLYMVEYNAQNIQILKTRFGTKCHIIHADFLLYDFGELQFEGVLGNPPFQIPKKDVYKGSVGNRTLWISFVKKILEEGLIKRHGYFGFLTPSSWRRPENNLYHLMTQDNHLRFLHIFSKKQGYQLLHVQTRFDIYVIQEGHRQKNQPLSMKMDNIIRFFLVNGRFYLIMLTTNLKKSWFPRRMEFPFYSTPRVMMHENYPKPNQNERIFPLFIISHVKDSAFTMDLTIVSSYLFLKSY